MEAAGLVFGATGFAAAIFSASVDCFNFVDSCRAYGRDYEMVLTKLDIEKTRLLQWGHGVGLCSGDPQNGVPGLDSNQMVERVLNCICLLLTDADKLRSKYGMETSEVSLSAPSGDMALASVSRYRLLDFTKKYADFRRRIALRQKRTSTSAKMTWAICDSSRFALLVNDLREYINGLYEIVQVPSQDQRNMVREDIGHLSADLGTLTLVEMACSERGDDWSEIASMQVQDSERGTQDGGEIMEWMEGTSMPRRRNRKAHIPYPGKLGTRHGYTSVKSTDASALPGYVIPRLRFRDRTRTSDTLRPGDDAFAEHLIRYGISPEGWNSLQDMGGQKPRNFEGIGLMLRQEQPSLLTSSFSYEAYHRFEKTNRVRTGRAVEDSLIFLLTGDTDPECFARSIKFGFCKNLTDGKLPKACPDLFSGAVSYSLEQDVLDDLSRLIVPSTTKDCPIAPNFFLEVGSKDDSAEGLERTASYYGALGARGILSLQNWGKDEDSPDGNAYTFTSTLFDGTLCIYATYPRTSSGNIYSTEYRTTLLGSWVLTACLEDFQRGMIALHNIFALAETMREDLIAAANGTFLGIRNSGTRLSDLVS